MPFRPNPNDTISITDTTCTFTEHPAAPGMAYGQAGRRGTVYQLADEQGGLWALKVFLPQYREPRLAGQAERLQALASLPGLRAAERTVLTSSQHRSLIREHLDLAYAVQMSWITGRTWMEVVLSKGVLSPLEALQRASALAFVLVGMEERGLAHCDLSGPNVILPPDGGAELVDLEEMYGPDLMKPEQLPGGSPGYAHRTAPQGLWNSRADRFSGAVLLGEMLGWCDERVVNASWGEGYFQPEEMGEESERTRLLRQVLVERWGREPAELFGRAWAADTLAMMPTFNEWAAVLPEDLHAVSSAAQTNQQIQIGNEEKPERVEAEDAAPDPAFLILAAERAHREGRIDEARDNLEMAREYGGISLREEITRRLLELEDQRPDQQRETIHEKPLNASSTDTWMCPVCGHAVSISQSVCPVCEKGINRDLRGPSGGSGYRSADGAGFESSQRISNQEVGISPRQGKSAEKKWSWVLGIILILATFCVISLVAFRWDTLFGPRQTSTPIPSPTVTSTPLPELGDIAGSWRQGYSNRMDWCPDGSCLAVAGGSGVYIYRIGYEEAFAKFSTEEEADGVAFSQDGRLIAVASRDGLVRIWEFEAGNFLTSFETNQRYGSDYLIDLAFSENGEYLLAFSSQGGYEVYDASDFSPIHRSDYGVNSSGGSSGAIAVNPDSSIMAAFKSGKVHLFSIPAMNYFESIDPEGRVDAGDIDPTGRILAAGAGNDVNLYQLDNQLLIDTFDYHDASIRGIDMAEQGHLIASIDNDGDLYIWDYVSGESLYHRNVGGQSNDVEFSPDGSFVAFSNNSYVIVMVLVGLE